MECSETLYPPSPEEWDTSLLPAERRRLLDAAPVFEWLARELADAALVISARPASLRDPPKAERRRFAQIIYRLEVPPTLFDRLHNGRDGLRGRYWQGEARGDVATRLIIESLLPKLNAAPFSSPEGKDKPWPMQVSDVEASLAMASTKVWVAERGRDRSGLIRADNPEHLLVRRWMENEPESGKGPGWRWTPSHGDLEIKGALIDERHAEHIPASKRDRAMQIWKFGWT